MKIVHIAPNSPYNDYWGYQDNLLPKYQKKLGNDVTIITTNLMHRDGKIVETECADYRLEDGVRVVRARKRKFPIAAGIFSHIDVMTYLESIKPDFIFFHGMISTCIYEVVQYKKKVNPSCVIVQDNHMDYNIGFAFRTIKEKMVRVHHRNIVRLTISYISRVYGVTPWRKAYAEDYFQVPKTKTDILIMGADDEKIDFEHRTQIRMNIRQQYGIKDEEFLIVTGGKIDKRKKIHHLMKACDEMHDVKLLIFGNVNDDIKDEFEQLFRNNKNIIYIGWIDSDKVYDYFFAADLVFFPGQHSVLWEQACASKVPCVFEKWEGMEHVNNGGNSDFVDNVTVESLREKILELKFTPKYDEMKKVAESEKTDVYLYSHIAEKSLECAKKL